MTLRQKRIPKQKRSKEQVEKLKAAALRLFSNEGYYQTSSNRIAKEAGVSIGTFYAYYTDKKDVFIDLFHDYNQTVIHQLPSEVIMTDQTPHELVSTYVNQVFHAHQYRKDFHNECLVLMQSDSEIRHINVHYETEMIKRIAYQLQQYTHSENDMTTNAYIIFRATESVIHDIIQYDDNHDITPYVEELINMLVAYLTSIH